jgi:hypothetical protein
MPTVSRLCHERLDARRAPQRLKIGDLDAAIAAADQTVALHPIQKAAHDGTRQVRKLAELGLVFEESWLIAISRAMRSTEPRCLR